MLTFAGADRAPLPPWRPGAHLDIHLPSGRVRQYSLCGDPARPDGYRIAVRRIPDGGGGSAEVHEILGVGSQVTTHGPRNAFPLTVPGYGSPTQRLRFVAAGIGITPILPMVRHVERLGVEWSMVTYAEAAAETACRSSTKWRSSARASTSGPTICTAFRRRLSCCR